MKNANWIYFSDEKFSGVVLTLGQGQSYFYRAPDGKRYECKFIARRGSRVRVGMRPVDEDGVPIPKEIATNSNNTEGR